MRFSCDSCGTKYSIGDEKVRGKVLRVRCKKCGASILVKEDAPEAEDAGETTRVVKPDEVQRAMAEAGLSPQAPGAIPSGKFVANRQPAKPAAAAPPKPPDKKIWHAMLQGKQSGPFTLAELAAHVASGQVTQRTYIWRDGMNGWQRTKDVAEVAEIFPSAAAPPPPPPAEEQSTLVEAQAPAEVRAAVEAAEKAAKDKAAAEKAAKDKAASEKAAKEKAAAERASAEKAAADKAAAEKAASEKAAKDKAAKDKAAAEKAASEKAAKDKAAAEKASAEKAAKDKAAKDKVAAEKAAAEKAAAEKAAAEKAAADQAALDQAAADQAAEQAAADEAAASLSLDEVTAAGAPEAAESVDLFGTEDETTAAGGELPFVASSEPVRDAPGEKTPAPADGGLAAFMGELEVSDPGPVEKVTAPFEESAAASGPLVGGAAAGPANDDPFANVPDAPGFTQAAPGEATNAIIRASGAKERNWGKTIAAAAVMLVSLGAAAFVAAKYQKDIVVAAAPERQAKQQFQQIDTSQLDQATLDVLSGENIRRAEREKAEAEARARAEAEAKAKAEADAAAAKAAGSGGGGMDDMNAMLAKDVDTEGAIKDVKADKAAPVEVTPDQLALLATLQAGKKGMGGPGGAGPKSFVADDAFDVKKATKSDDGGGLAPEVLSKKFDEAKPGFQNCIANALRRNPNQKLGKVVITVTIAPSGVVQAATFDKKDLADTELGGCLRTTIKRVVFPSFEGEPFDVEFPLVLGAG